MSAEYIAETIDAACSLAAILKAEGDLKGAREILDKVADIQNKIMYLTEWSKAE